VSKWCLGVLANKKLFMAKLRNFFNRRSDISYRILLLATFFIIFLSSSFNSFSQNQTILKGIIVDEKSQEPLIGSSIQLKRTSKGTVTDGTGAFQLTIDKKLPVTLIVSSIGYRTQEIDVYENELLKISLAEDVNRLSAVVVVGYGTTKREELTGSIASVKVSQLKEATPISFVDGLQGLASGIQVTTASGAPGAASVVRIRGGNSITGGNDPLYVIDGFPIYNNNASTDAGALYGGASVTVGTTNGLNPLASLNPDDIESIDILKDASATAIYGSRGANGVIIVTTKKGKVGKIAVTYDGSYGFQTLSKKIDVLNAAEYDRYRTDAGLTNVATGSTDWQNEAYRTAPTQKHDINVSGGNEKTKFSSSVSYLDQDGILVNTDYKRYTGRLSIDSKISDKANVGFNFNQSYSSANVGKNTSSILSMPPDQSSDVYVSPYEDATGNPVSTVKNSTNQTIVQRTLSTGFGEYELLKGLKAKVLVGVDLLTNRQYSYIPSSIYAGQSVSGSAAIGSKYTTNWLNENTLTYTKSLKEKHNIDFITGYTQQESVTQGSLITATGFTNDVTTYNAVSAATSKSITSSYSKWNLESFLARVNYNYNHKYFLTASFRADGSSRLGENNKWGYFPSGSVAWQVDKENFLLPISNPIKLSELKIRVSYGRTGNQEITPYQSLSLLRNVSYTNGDGTSLITGYSIANIANPDLKWETTNQVDGGVDIGFFKGKFKLTADFYYKRTSDLLLNVAVPYTSGYATALENIGEVENKGYDLGLSTENINTKSFNWTSNVTFSVNRNKILSLGGQDQILVGGGSDVGSLIKVGYALGTFYGYKSDGLYTTTNLPSDLSTTLYGVSTAVGDVKYKDLSGDGKITSDDQTVIGHAQPKFIYGFTNNFKYKNFDLSIFLQGSYGNQIYSQLIQSLMNVNGYSNSIAAYSDHYTSTNTTAKYSRPNTKIQSISNSDLYVFDGSYLKIKSVTLGYAIPKRLLKKAKLTNVRLYASVTNLFTFTDYPGYDPDINSYSENASRQGVDLGAYPSSKTFLGGINVTF